MIERMLLALCLVAVCAFGIWLVRRTSPFQPVSMLLAFTVAIGCFYPVSTAFFEPITWRNVTQASDDIVLGVQGDYLAFAVGLVLALLVARLFVGALVTHPVRDTDPQNDGAARFRDTAAVWVMLGIGTVLYGLYAKTVGLGALLDQLNRAEKYRLSEGLGPLVFGLNVIIAAVLWAEASPLSRAQKNFFRAVALAVSVWAVFFLAVRSYAVALVFGYLFVLARRNGYQIRRVKPILVVLVLACYLGLEGFVLVRGAWTDGFVQAVERVRGVGSDLTVGRLIGSSELAHPFMTSLELAVYEEGGSLEGDSYLASLTRLVPLVLMPDRPASLAQSYVAEYYPSLADRGGGAAFSMVGEAWWNFGPVLGPLFLGLALGAALLVLERHLGRRPHGVVARILPCLLIQVLTMHRSTLATTLKLTMTMLIPVLLMCLAFHLAWLALRSRSERAGPVVLARGGDA